MENGDPESLRKCSCDDTEEAAAAAPSNRSVSPTSSFQKEQRKSRISLTSLGWNLRRGRSVNLTCKRSKKTSNPGSTSFGSQISTSKKSSKWAIMKLNCSWKEPKGADNQSCCQCKCYRRTSEHALGEGIVFGGESSSAAAAGSADKTDSIVELSSNDGQEASGQVEQNKAADCQVEVVNRGEIYSTGNIFINAPIPDLDWNLSRNAHEDCDEEARLQRAREIEVGVEAPPDFRPCRRVQLLYSDELLESGQAPRRLQLVCPPDLTVDSLRAFFQNRITLKSCPLDTITGCHTQVDFIHCLVPDLQEITNCSFYWGKMDRYEAERLLDGKPEGTFLLRDSAQEEFLFSVSFRKYSRSLHARIEQWNHKFSFDSHDPGVFTSDTVCGLIKHYKDPSSCMFFEPMLTLPLHRNFSFSLQHLCRAGIVSKIKYDDINQLQLPKSLKAYLKEYHYRQKVRVERFEDDVQWFDLRNVSSL